MDDHDTTANDGDQTADLGIAALPPSALCWRCDPAALPFDSTAEVEPVTGVVGQETAVEALSFGLECRAPGQNIFVRGLSGTGRMTLVRRLLEDLDPSRPEGHDRCYVRNFDQPERPRLINLPPGTGRTFRRLVDDLADFVRDELRRSLTAEGITARRGAIDRVAEDRIKSLVTPLEKAAVEASLALVTVQMGPISHVTIFPRIDDKPVPPEEFEQLRRDGKISDEKADAILAAREEFQKRLEDVNRQIHGIQREHTEDVRRLLESEARAILLEFVTRIRMTFPQEPVREFLEELVVDVVDRRLAVLGEDADFTRLYRVNVLLEHVEDEPCPVIVENTPTMTNLLGGVDQELIPPGISRSDHLMIRAGSLLRADGGFLIMEARDVLTEPGAWKVLVRTLRSGKLEIVPPELSLPWLGQSIKPEPIDLDVKVVLIGDAQIFYLLDGLDPDFPNLFKLLADFDPEIPRDDVGIGHYAGVLSRIAREEELLPLDRTAVAALVEHGARVAARPGKLTARFGRLADLAREASFIATKASRERALGEDVRTAIQRTKARASLPARRFQERMADGTICIQTDGRVVGQVNGLAVQMAGSLVSGFPARITATIGPGSSGVINIEREAALSGAIHTKGFYILGGLLRHLLQTDHPLAFTASIAFEQSYGGIDGDSASGAEICCLLSALTDVPLRQGIAMTGAIDQKGHVLAIGAVNEKIEGFFDVCSKNGLSDEQGVIIPRANAGDLMLRPDIVAAVEAGRFQVYAVDTVQEALTLLAAVPAGTRDDDGTYPDDTLLGLAVQRAKLFWLRAAAPSTALIVGRGDEEDADQPTLPFPPGDARA